MKIKFYNKKKGYYKTESDLINEICIKKGIAKNELDIIKIYRGNSLRADKYFNLLYIQNKVKQALKNWDSTQLYFEI